MKRNFPDWSIEDDEILIEFYPKEKTKEVCKKLSVPRTESSVTQRALKLNLKKNSYEFWSETDLTNLKKSYADFKKNELQALFPNRSWFKIKAKARDLQLKKRTKSMDQILGDLKPLLKDSPESLYWVGFILADGHISKKNRLQITLSSLDVMHLKKFSNFIKLNSLASREKTCSIKIMDQDLISQLKNKYDIKNNKTVNPPELSIYQNLHSDLWWSLIVGFIDGDGCIQNQTYREDIKVTIKCHRSWLDFLNLLAERLSFETGLLQPKAKINNAGYASLIISRKESVKFLASQALKLSLIPLERKWNKIFLNPIYDLSQI
jgi:hypothetical protein